MIGVPFFVILYVVYYLSYATQNTYYKVLYTSLKGDNFAFG
jgi:hypothetical protein